VDHIPDDVIEAARVLNMRLHSATELGQRTQWIAEALMKEREHTRQLFPDAEKIALKDVAERLSAIEAIIVEMRSSLNIKTDSKSVALKEWLKKNGITQSDFAEAVGIHFVHMNKFVNRKKRPGVHLIERIEKATGGEVNFESWREVSP